MKPSDGLMAAVVALFLVHPLNTFAADEAWEPYQFLVGEWVGEGGGKPGTGTGQFSFAFDLQGKILVRKNRADYPAAPGRPASSHEDLMIVYRDPSAQRMRAIYFDNEEHVIHYDLAFSRDGRTLTFLSETAPGAPRFRLSYTKSKGETLDITFEIAPPGKPDAFQKYLEGRAHRAHPRPAGATGNPK